MTSKGKEKKEKRGARAGAVGIVSGGCGAVRALENGKSPSTHTKKCILLFSGASTDENAVPKICVCVCVCPQILKSPVYSDLIS